MASVSLTICTIVSLLVITGDCSPYRLLTRRSSSSTFGYERGSTLGPSNWFTLPGFEVCGSGDIQSPIDINPSFIRPGTNDVYTLNYLNLPDKLEGKAENSGHNIVFREESETIELSVTEQGMEQRYILVEVHFHRGTEEDSTRGSEHSIDDTFFPMEQHAVHYNTRYTSLGDALGKVDGVLVIATLFKKSVGSSDGDNGFDDDSGEYCSAADEFIQEFAPQVPQIHDEVPAEVDSRILSIPDRLVSYIGSLTTPPCTEGVRFVVDMDMEKTCISEKALDEFGELLVEPKVEKLLVDGNRRPIQRRNVNVQANFDLGSSDGWSSGSAHSRD